MMRLLPSLLLAFVAIACADDELNADDARDLLAGHIDEVKVKRSSVLSSAAQSVPSLAKAFAANLGQAAQVGGKVSSGFNAQFTDSCLKSSSPSFGGFPIQQQLPIWKNPFNPSTGIVATRAAKQLNNRDYIFVLDTSASIPNDQFEKAKQAIITLVESFCPIALGKEVTTAGNKQVAVVMFGTRTTLDISFDDSHKGIGYLKDKINSLRHRQDGGTSTATALRYVKDNVLGKGSSRIDKTDVSTDVIVITDGRCNQACTSLGVDADGLRGKGRGANVFALGIANSRACELEIISGKGNGLSYGLGDFQEFDKFAIAVAEIAKENDKKCA